MAACKDCKFYDADEGWCRRRAPIQRTPHEFNIPSFLQAIAVAQLTIAKLNIDEFDDDLKKETTEHYEPKPWPVVDEDDWCGEFEQQ
jgi:hypothetical protein